MPPLNPHQGSGPFGLLGGEGQIDAKAAHRAMGWIGYAFIGLGHSPLKTRTNLSRHGPNQGRAVSKVVVETALGDLSRQNNLINGDGVDGTLGKELAARIQQGLTGQGGAPGWF